MSAKKPLIGAFAFSGFMAAVGGAMLSCGLALATPSGVSDVLVPAPDSNGPAFWP